MICQKSSSDHLSMLKTQPGTTKKKEKFYSVNFEKFVKVGTGGGVANHPLGFFRVKIFRKYFTIIFA